MKYFTRYCTIYSVLVALLVFSHLSIANQYRSKASGLWATPATWSVSTDGGATWADASNTPGTLASDSVLVRDTHTIAINTTTTIAYLKVGEGTSGILEYDGIVRTLTLTGDLDILTGSTFRGPNTGTLTSILMLGGNVFNNGTFNMYTGSGRVTDVTFNKNGNQIFSGSGSTIFNKIILNMGTSKLNTLDFQSVISMSQASGSPTLTLTNGSFKLSSASTIRPFGGTNFTIGSTAGYILNHASAVSQWGSNSSLIVSGDLIINNGTMTISSAGGANRLDIGATGRFIIGAGTLTINGRLVSNVAGGVVTINGGTVAIAPGGAVNTASNSIFEIANSTFTMTNGTVSVASGNANTTLPDININLSGTPVTGGSFLITSGTVVDTISVSSNAPLYNFQVQNGTAAVTAQLRNNTLQIQNNFTVTSGTLDANSRDITVGGNWSNAGTFIYTGNTVTFNGSGVQSISKTGGEIFNHLSMNKSAGSLTLNNSITVNGNLTLSNGMIADGGNIITVIGNVTNSATHTGSGKILLSGGVTSHTISGSGTFSNLELNDAINASLSASPTVGGSLLLTAGTLTVGASNSLQMANGSSIVQTSGSLASGTNGGTISFMGGGTITGTLIFNNVTIGGAVNFGTSSTIGFGGALVINSGGSVLTNPPTFNSGSTLKYFSGGTYQRGLEWSSTSSAGYPASVTIGNNTTLDLGFGGASTQRKVAENIQIDGGSTLSMAVTPMTASLEVLGSINNDGTLTLSTSSGGDLLLYGNFASNGTFYPSGRSVNFLGGNIQQLSKSIGSFDFDYIILNKNNGVVLLDNNVTILAPAGGNSIQYDGTNDVIDLNGKTLTLSGTIGGINTTGGLKGSGSSNLVINGTGALGTLRFISGGEVLNNLTVNRTSSGSVSLGSDLTVSGVPTFTDGSFEVGAHTFSLNGSAIAGVNTNLTTTSSSNLNFGGTSSGVVLPASVSNINNLTINNPLNVTAGGNPTVHGTLTVSNGDLVTESNTITLGMNATISEAADATVLGNLTTTRNITATSGTQYFGNIGSDITLNGTALGSTTILRKTGTASTGNSHSSILRYFNITPTNNSGLNSTLSFHYDASELNSQDPSTLRLFKSIDDGATWTNRGGIVNTTEKTITLTGVSDFSRWTASNDLNSLGETPIPILTSISPDNKVTGESGFTLNVTGNNFVDGQSALQFDGSSRSTTFFNESQLTAIIPATDLTTAGNKNITVFNNGGGGISNSLTFTVNKASTTTALASSINPSVYGQSVTLTATVTVNSPGSGTPTGSISFKDGVVTIGSGALNGLGQATLSTSTLDVGSHSITAEYVGDSNYNGSVSSSTIQNVNKASTTTSLTSSTNPSVRGESVLLTASVVANSPGTGIPTGMITFKDGGVIVDTKTVDVSGEAILNLNTLSVGSHTLTAEYSGDTHYEVSASGDLTQTVNKAQTVTTLISSLNPSAFGQNINFTATVTVNLPGVAMPTGTVVLKEGGTTLGSGSVDGSGQVIFAISSLVVGSHDVHAEYSGDANCESSNSSAVTQVVDKKSTSSILTININPSVYLDEIILKDSVYGSVPDGGTVQFKDGVVNLGSPISIDGNGVATLSISSLIAGSHNLSAEYSGTTNYDGSISNTVVQTVQKRSTVSYLTSSQNPSLFGESVTFKDSVVGSVPDGGTVQFKDGPSDIGSPVPIDANGVAVISISNLSVGSHSITGSYSGTTNYLPSVSNTVNQIVGIKTTTSYLSSSLNPSVYGTMIVFKDSVYGSVPDGGTVQFKDGVSNLGAPVSIDVNGVAVYTTSDLSAGSHSITAEYSGTSNYSPSISNTINQVVNKKSTTSVLVSSLNPSSYGEAITLTDSVYGSVPDGGTVQFKDNGVNVGSPIAINANGVSILTISTLSAGNHNITAEYSGTSNFEFSTSNTIVQSVNQTITYNILTSSLNPSYFGDVITLRDSIVNTEPGLGTVQFKDNGINLGAPTPLGLNSTVDLVISNFTVGTHTITAHYSGGINYQPSISNVVLQIVNRKPTSSVLTTSDIIILEGELLVLKDSVFGSIPDGGTVQFMDGAVPIGSLVDIDTDGLAILEISTLAIGRHTISAVYSGTINYEASISNSVSVVIGDSNSYRSFCADSIALSKDNKGKYGLPVKRKPVRTQFSFVLTCQSIDATGLQLEFSNSIDVAYPFTTTPPSQMAAVDTRSKKWDFIFNPPLALGQTVTLSGYENNGKPQKIIKYFWKKYGIQDGYTVRYPVASINIPKLPMPNRINVLAEIFMQGGYDQTYGLIVGKDRKLGEDSSKYYAWYQTSRYSDVIRTLYASRVGKLHTGYPKGFDQFIGGRLLHGKQKLMPPTKYDNILLADMIALKVSITSSAMGKTPFGFGELIFDDPTDQINPFNGRMLKELASIGDSLMMGYYENGSHLFADSSSFEVFDQVIRRVTLAFEGGIDTLTFADSLVLLGANVLADVPFIRRNPSIVPAIIIPINNLTEELPVSYRLDQNYPNPFNPVTTIEFDLPVQSNVTLNLFNIVGQQVATIIDNEILDEGTHQFDYHADRLSSGVYFYRLSAVEVPAEDGSKQGARYTRVKKMVLMK